MRHPRRRALTLVAALFVLGACASPSPTSMGGMSASVGRPAMSGAAGVNVGGAQDIKLARETIAQGGVPRPEQFMVQGLYAEHDLPLGTAPAGKLLHLDLGLGIAPARPDGAKAHWVQVALGTGLTGDQLKRPPLQIVVVADQSGSMMGDKIVALRAALTQLVDKLGPQDQLAIQLFDDDANVLADLQPVTNKAGFKSLISKIVDDGGTNIELGLREGRKLFNKLQPTAGMQRRILLFTDAVPNIGATDAESFQGLVSRYANEGIGLTAFGIGLDFGAQLAEAIGNQKGGNYVFLRGAEDVAKVFAEDFDYLMTPVAYDFTMSVTAGEGFKLTHVYGASATEDANGDYALKVKSLFFSKNRGAIVMRLAETTPGAGANSAVVASGKLSYTPATGGAPVDETITAAATGDRPADPNTPYFAPAATRKAVALTNMYLGMKAAVSASGDKEAARLQLAAVKAELQAARDALKDAALDPEIALVEKLAANMKVGALTLATPSPSPSPTASATPSPSGSPTASPSPSPTASPAPAASPTATPSPSPAP